MLIDFHTHAFPDVIAPRAMAKLSQASGGMMPATDGTVTGLRASMKRAGVDLSVMLSIATNAHQMRSVNDFAASLNGKDGILSFGSVFPFAPDALEEAERVKALGLKGIKLHPDYQGFSADDERLFPLYKKISSLGLVTVFHAGEDYGFPPPYGGTPDKLLRAFRHFESPVVAAHYGGLNMGEEVLSLLAGHGFYFDTSFSYAQMPRYYAERILEKQGAEHMLFGTDTPWHTPEEELRLLRALGLSGAEWEAVTHGNAERLLGLSKR
ncbi:MAG: amidohydrolase family protein [Clostridia bacterium]|nr:amidohydrolase family protein [Clostridia bacterium]MBO7170415.1 amidohydrolase family protein [Clostridia bacterium]